jgi:ornithine cyclodeaminase
LLRKAWIRPGTHIACMGTDTKGKQEIDPMILAGATVFTDEVAQSVTIGEAQHAVAAAMMSADDITPIGAVINGTHPGRSSADEITVFDGTGVGLQDLAVASVAARIAQERGLATEAAL